VIADAATTLLPVDSMRCWLAPVAFDPDVLSTATVPVSGDPARVGMRRLGIVAGDPDIVIALPAVVAGVPVPVAMFRRRRRNYLAGWPRRPNGDVDLGSGAGRSKAE
jgi:hypothetical protein